MTNNLCKPNLILIAGPTAVGKTALSIEMAKALKTEIISADSVQVYRGMDIGSAKITKEEMEGIPHHLIDILNPDEDFNVSLFKDLALDAAISINEKGKIPILAGGTGFYIQALVKNVDFNDNSSNPKLRLELENKAKEIGNEGIHNLLNEVDPSAAEQIPAGNVKRIIRALEYFYTTGNRISDHNEVEREKESYFNSLKIILTDNREILYDRINKRVDLMMSQGLLDEVKSLYASGIKREAVSVQSLGYRQIYDYLYGDCSLEEAVEQIKLQTRHFAKRQITWFKREPDCIWVNKSDFDHDEKKILDYCLVQVRNKYGLS